MPKHHLMKMETSPKKRFNVLLYKRSNSTAKIPKLDPIKRRTPYWEIVIENPPYSKRKKHRILI